METGLNPAWQMLEMLPTQRPQGDEVWVWSFSTLGGSFLPALEALLDDREAQRAGRLRSNRAQAEFVSGRGLLRLAMGKILGLPASEVRFGSVGNGKPVLDGSQTHQELHFNLAHSHGMGLLAIASHAGVGVDVERLRVVSDQVSLAKRYFHPNEVAHLEMLQADGDRLEAFFHAWTRKEAFLKATGTGIGFGLDRVEVTLGPEVTARLVRIDESEDAAVSWTLRHLEPGNGWMAALALKAPCGRLVTSHVDLGLIAG